MKIIINNFGPIQKFSYDLNKDFIVTYGNNNIGKSYSMQIVYLLLKTLIYYTGNPRYNNYNNFFSRPHYIFGLRDSDVEKLKKIILEFFNSKDDFKDITSDIFDQFYSIISNDIMPSFMNSCENTFGNIEKILEQNPTINIEFENFNFTLDLNKKKILGTIDTFSFNLKRTNTDFHKSRRTKKNTTIYVYSSETGKPLEVILNTLSTFYISFTNLVRKNFNSVYYLPASRSGIYSGMNAFGAIVAELSKNRAMLTKKIELPGISEPISDYFIFLSNIRYKTSDRYLEYYSKIENDILKGKVSIEKNKNTLIYIPNDIEAEFKMTEVSSMVSEVSPIVAFLKFIMDTPFNRSRSNTNSILFIEEPEAHLHPNNQIALIEIFAQLASVGVKLIISSHSNYVFNKLNNLVLSGKLDYNKYQPIILKMQEKGSISKNIELDELGATDENFIDVSEKLYNEREEIIQNLNTGE